MSVEFNEGPVLTPRSALPRYSFPTRLLLKTGIVRTPQGAAIVLFVLAILALLLSYSLFSKVLQGPPVPNPADFIER